MKKKKPFTLLEIMIVICLIGLISSIIGYSMKGSLDEGRAFKTKQAQERIRDLIEMELAKGYNIEKIKEHPENYIEATGLVRNVSALFRDGWNEPFDIEITEDAVTVTSKKLNAYESKKDKQRKGN